MYAIARRKIVLNEAVKIPKKEIWVTLTENPGFKKRKSTKRPSVRREITIATDVKCLLNEVL